MNPDSAAQTPLAALWRTREYLRPYYLSLALMLTAAIGAATAEIAIPLLIKAVIDGPIAHGSMSALLPLGLAASMMAVGLLQNIAMRGSMVSRAVRPRSR